MDYLYKENLSKKDKMEKWGALAFLLLSIGFLLFGWHWMLRESASIHLLTVYGVTFVILIAYVYKKKFSPDFYKEIVEIYDDRLIINRTISKSVFPKEDIDKVYMINWNLPPSFQRFNPGKRVMGFAVDKKDGYHYYTKEKPKHVIDKILVEIEKHWGDDYVGETVNKDMGW